MKADLGAGRRRRVANKNAGAKRTASIVDLGLRKIERVCAFDVARTHVVADGVADDLTARIDDERKLGLGYGPRGIAANFYRTIRARDFGSESFEEQLRPLGRVDAIIKIAPSRVLRFCDARATAAVVGNTRGPDLLVADWREQRCVQQVIGRRVVVDSVDEVCVKIVMGEERVERGVTERVRVIVVTDEECFFSSIEDHAADLSLRSGCWG